MKIIERHPDKRVGRFRCDSCMSVVETEYSDIPQMQRDYEDEADVRDPGYWWIACPVCRNRLRLSWPMLETTTE